MQGPAKDLSRRNAATKSLVRRSVDYTVYAENSQSYQRTAGGSGPRPRKDNFSLALECLRMTVSADSLSDALKRTRSADISWESQDLQSRTFVFQPVQLHLALFLLAWRERVPLLPDGLSRASYHLIRLRRE